MNNQYCRRALAGGAVWAALAVAEVQPALAQVEVSSRAMAINFTGRLHTQFNASSVDGERGSEFLIRRARMTMDLTISDLISARLMPEFAGGAAALEDAYVRFSFSPGFRVTVGQFKRAFDLFELTSSTQTLVIERAGDIRGVDACAGPGGTCSFSRLTGKLEFAGRDIGVLFDGRSGNVDYLFSVTNGAGLNTVDDNGRKSYSGRVSIAASDGLRIAGNLAVHDFVNTVLDDDDYAIALGGDIEVGNFSEGFHLQAGAVGGQNWRNLDANGNPSDFLTMQAIGSFRQPVSDHRFIEGFEPVGRISWGDPNGDLDDDQGILVTPGLMLHFVGRNKIAANVDIWLPGQGDTEWSLKVQSYMHF